MKDEKKSSTPLPTHKPPYNPFGREEASSFARSSDRVFKQNGEGGVCIRGARDPLIGALVCARLWRPTPRRISVRSVSIARSTVSGHDSAKRFVGHEQDFLPTHQADRWGAMYRRETFQCRRRNGKQPAVACDKGCSCEGCPIAITNGICQASWRIV